MIAIVHFIYSQSVHAPALNAGLMDNDDERYCTSLYLKKSFHFKPRPDLELKKNMFESSVIEIEKNVMNSKCNIIVGILYRSPNSS